MQGGRERLFTGRKINKKDIFTCFVESRGRHAACFLSTADAWRRQARRAEKSGRGERNSRVLQRGMAGQESGKAQGRRAAGIGLGDVQSCRSSRRLSRMQEPGPRNAPTVFSSGGGRRARPGRRLRASERPARGRQGMGAMACAKGAGLRPCAMRTRRTRRTPEKNGLFGFASGLPESGGDSGAMPCAPAHSCLACRRRGRGFFGSRFIPGPGCAELRG